MGDCLPLVCIQLTLRAKNQRALNEKLKGTTLATADKEDLDNKAWLRKLAKRQKKHAQELAAKKAKELEDKYADTYGEEDLSGLKVGHKTDDFEAGEDTILTLKDSGVLAGDGKLTSKITSLDTDVTEDELVNVNMVDKQKDRELRETRKKGLEKYSGYDDEEFDENRIGTKAEVLSKYNDEFSTGKVRSEGFRLGAPTEQKRKADEEDEMMTIGQAPKTMVKLNLDFAKDFEVSDYMREGDKGFKARKPKKAKRSVRKQEDAEDGEGMEVDGEPTFAKRVVDETPQNLVDDDDMQAALARQRRENAKKRPKVKVEDLAARSEFDLPLSLSPLNPLVASQRQEEETQPRENGDEDGRITFDDTSEFVRNVALESRVAPVKRERAASPPVAGPSRSAEPEVPVVVKIEREEGAVDEDEDMDSEDEDEALAEMAAREGLSLAEYRIKIDAQMAEMEQVKREGEEVRHRLASVAIQTNMQAASTEEAVVGNGMAGVLNLLRQQGALKKRTAEEEERERVQKQRDLWLADYRRRQAERELERIQARGGNKDQAQREWENRMREQNEAKDALEVYKNYKPDINIVYHDEFGRGKYLEGEGHKLTFRNDTKRSLEVAIAQVPVRVAFSPHNGQC